MSGRKTPVYNGKLTIEHLPYTKCAEERCHEPGVVKCSEGGASRILCLGHAEQLRQYAKKNSYLINIIGVTNMAPYDLDKSGRPLLPRGEEAIRAPRTTVERDAQAGEVTTEDLQKRFDKAFKKQPEKPEVKTKVEAWTAVKEVCRLTHTTFPTGCGDSLHVMIAGELLVITLELRKDRKTKIASMTPIVRQNNVEITLTVEQIGELVAVIGGKYRGSGKAWAMYWPHS